MSNKPTIDDLIGIVTLCRESRIALANAWLADILASLTRLRDAEKAMPEEPEYLIRLRNALKGFKSDGAFAGDKDIVAYIDALRAYAVQKESENNRRLALLKEAHDKMFSCTGSCGNEIFDKIGYELVREFDK